MCAETLLNGISLILLSPDLRAQQKKPKLWNQMGFENAEKKLVFFVVVVFRGTANLAEP